MMQVKIPPHWKRLVDSIHREKGVVVVLGASNTGKTTLSCYIAGELCRMHNRVSIISADMGQCAFGPPATISMSMLELPPRSLLDIPVHAMYFIGSTSPVGHLLQTVVGVKKLVDRSSQEGAEVIVVDTTGLVSGGAAWELKFHKIELTEARCIVALQRGDELGGILRPHEHRTGRRIFRLPVSEHTRVRSHEQRREYRRQRYDDYFRNASVKLFSIKDICLINPQNVAIKGGEGNSLKKLLVGLNDVKNFTAALGIVQGINLEKEQVRLLTPLEKSKDIRIIRLGSVRIEENWTDTRVRFV